MNNMIVFFNNYLNHHQALIADALWELTKHNYTFVATTPMPEFRKRLGYRELRNRPYLLDTYNNVEGYNKAMQLAMNADVALFGGGNILPFKLERMKLGKISFEVSERWLKRGWLNLFSPRLMKNLWYYHTRFYNKPLFKLCASAYAANDQYLLRSFKNRCYKWGYFTKVEEFEVEKHVNSKPENQVRMMWCARFLDWKHPEMVVKLAKKMQENGYQLKIDMFGSGSEQEKTMRLCKRLGVDDMVSFKGNKPNDEILAEMRRHDIFLFTSDRNEGWGAVLNEAMSNGCAVVASHEIGSVPFLVNDGKNGMIFKSKNIDSLYEKVVWLVEHPNVRKRMAINAYYTMKNKWSPEVAARNLLTLIDDLQHGRDTSIKEGPCSKALPI